MDILEDGGKGQWGRGMVSEPRASSCTCHAVYLPGRPLGAVHTLPLPPFIIGAMNQARNRPVRLMGIQQGPHSPLPWLLQGQVMPLAYSVLD